MADTQPASLERRESRWGLAYYRVDYLRRDDENWLRHVIIHGDPKKGKMTVTTRPVSAGRRGDRCP
ncbi:hypothetical protein DRO56_04670 [Candidatus Bathyarchaeota archaeon]|nr:MAG: hypothetical protein DRO56_04670 [Candidatus Bathyarchaeota archaeon]